MQPMNYLAMLTQSHNLLLLLSVACLSLDTVTGSTGLQDTAGVANLNHQLELETASEECAEEAFVVGACEAALRRWSFNAGVGACEQFVYGGCGANTNNFETETECNAACVTTSAVCTEAPFVVGMCRAIEIKWSYNTEAAACEQFTYGGCGGTDNNFNSEEECMDVCIRSGGSGAAPIPETSSTSPTATNMLANVLQLFSNNPHR